MHDLFNANAVDGEGKRHNWRQCRTCGCAKHSGYWWLGGYKSKVEPPCFIYPLRQPKLLEWQEQAIRDFDLPR